MGASILSLIANPPALDVPQEKATLAHTQALTGQAQAATLATEAARHATELENQARQRELHDQDVLQRAFANSNGDPSQVINYAMKNGASAKTVYGLQQNMLNLKKQASELTEAQKKVEETTHTEIGRVLSSMRLMSEADRVVAAPDAVAELSRLDKDHPWSPDQLVTDKALDATLGVHGAAGTFLGLSKEKQAIADAKAKGEREAAEAPLKLREATAQATTAEQKAAGTEPIQPHQQAQLEMDQKKLDQGLSELVEKVRHNKVDEGETARFHEMSLEGMTLTPEAKAKMAEMFAVTGQLPNMGYGKQAAKQKSEIINEAAAKFPQVDFATSKAQFQANSNSLKNLQKQSDQVDAFEGTAGRNIDIFLKAAKDIVDTGSPLLNAPVRMISDKILGSEKMAAFKAARETALTEAAKVLESPQGSSSLTVSGRDAVKTLSDPNATLGQQVASMKVLRQDMASRKQSNAEQIKAINDRIKTANPNEKGEVAKKTIRARDTNGVLHEAPEGTPLPAGWKEEK